VKVEIKGTQDSNQNNSRRVKEAHHGLYLFPVLAKQVAAISQPGTSYKGAGEGRYQKPYKSHPGYPRRQTD